MSAVFEHPARFYQGLVYVGTIQQAGRSLIFHLFEETSADRVKEIRNA
jgi:hypothetical protein